MALNASMLLLEMTINWSKQSVYGTLDLKFDDPAPSNISLCSVGFHCAGDYSSSTTPTHSHTRKSVNESRGGQSFILPIGQDN